MLQKISETIGSLALGQEAGNSTGLQHGGAGSAVTVNVEGVRAWLVARTPEQVDAQLLEQAKSSHGVEVSLRTELRFPEGRPAYRVSTGAELQVADPDQVKALAQRIEAAMTPPTKTQAEDWFYALRLATAGAKRSEMDEASSIALYTVTLAKYPADVTQAVFKYFTISPREDTSWFPTLPEMVAQAERMVSQRRSLLIALKSWKPADQAAHKEAVMRKLIYDAMTLENEAHMCRRSNPERNAELMAEVKVKRAEAAAIRRGEVQP